jgi:tRNA(Ile)-lysidine synthase
MALLNMLSNFPGVNLVVTHFNHGIRTDSYLDEALVRRRAEGRGLIFEAGYGHLGPTAGEAAAREARYNFLNAVKRQHRAAALITAHHQDDLIETALINILRGTGYRGLSAMYSNRQVLRPLLKYTKRDILAYATKNRLIWREDESNRSDDYLRNYLRRNLINRLSAPQRQIIIGNIDKVAKISPKIDQELDSLVRQIGADKAIIRSKFSNLPASLGDELLVHLLRAKGVREYDSKVISRLNMAIKTAQPRTSHDIKRQARLEVGQTTAQLVTS